MVSTNGNPQSDRPYDGGSRRGFAVRDGMHRYRWHSNINWGPCYDPESGAHYCSASDVRTLSDAYGPIDLHTLQVWTGSEWRWVTDTLRILGGLRAS